MKLFVIGNGFDIGHGIPCKYFHFQKYLNDNREV
ncbi:MAG: AbiH family protein [Flavobacteriales bacterium]